MVVDIFIARSFWLPCVVEWMDHNASKTIYHSQYDFASEFCSGTTMLLVLYA